MVKKKICVNVCAQKPFVCIHIECDSFSVPEHHDCSEAQYCLLKEMTETFPRENETQKAKKKKKKACEIL